MAEYVNDFANDEAWKDQDITVPLRSVLGHCESIATLNGIIDQLRDEARELTAIIDRITAKTEGGETWESQS